MHFPFLHWNCRLPHKFCSKLKAIQIIETQFNSSNTYLAWPKPFLTNNRTNKKPKKNYPFHFMRAAVSDVICSFFLSHFQYYGTWVLACRDIDKNDLTVLIYCDCCCNCIHEIKSLILLWIKTITWPERKLPKCFWYYILLCSGKLP